MSALIRIGSKSDMPPPGQTKEFTAAGKAICIANVNGSLAALDDVCLHRGASLGQGLVAGGKVVCPWHGWRWDPRSGKAVENPRLALSVYPVFLEGDDVLVEL